MIRITVNGVERRLEVRPEVPLLYVLRNDLCLNGPKFGCGLGECGACMVLMDGLAARSCAVPLRVASGRSVVRWRGSARWSTRIRCSRPSSTSRPPSAAIASTA